MIIDAISHEYGWTMTEIFQLTPIHILKLLSAIKKRHEVEFKYEVMKIKVAVFGEGNELDNSKEEVSLSNIGFAKR